MRIVLGLEWGGATLTPFDDRDAGEGAVGEVVWGPAELVGDLELRLGLGAPSAPEAVRTAKWAERMAVFAPRERFYTRSFAVDPLGTARAVLALRDLLIAAGWRGEPIGNGGARLGALAELEAARDIPLPAGFADRLTDVEQALSAPGARLYDEIALTDPRALWDSAWQRLFAALERRGTTLCDDVVRLPGAPPNTDLGTVQALLAGERTTEPATFRGDGTFIAVKGETAWEAARATAALLADCPANRTVIVRGHDASALDNALAVQGVSRQGVVSPSPWRAALQVVPLALELLFEPKDPYRVLELLTLARGPFAGFSGQRLARALSERPGIGNPEWERAKAQIAERADGAELLARVHSWLEQRGTPVTTAADKRAVLASIARARVWLLTRIASASTEATLLAAAQQAAALSAAIESDPRTHLSLIEVRRLAESTIASGARWTVSAEHAGRIDHVTSARGLRVPREHVVWWAFGDTEHPVRLLPWRRHEAAALTAHGLRFPDPRLGLDQRAQSWRRAARAATQRLILIVPRCSAGSALGTHPLWDELVGRTGESGAELSKIVVTTADLLHANRQRLITPSPLEPLTPVSLPGGRSEWVIGTELAPIERLSATSLGALLGCPLRWALQYRAGIKGRSCTLPPAHLLNGKLGHRLVELLHGRGAFDLEESALRQAAERELDELVAREGAMLLCTGAGLERSQLHEQLVHAVVELARSLRGSGLRIVAVEKPIAASFKGAAVDGSIDLLVAAPDGSEAIIDMKWGTTAYRDLLQNGQALQLAVYAFARRQESGSAVLPEAAYFSLSRGRLLSLRSRLWTDADVRDGPSLEDTLRHVDRTFDAVDASRRSRRLPVAGIRQAPRLLDALGVHEPEQHQYFALPKKKTCEYCDHDALCGRRWEHPE